MAVKIPFIREMEVEHGACAQLSPLIRRVVAPNPGPFTFKGTNTYIIGAHDEVAVIDPGPLLAEHVDALLRAIGDARVSHILITHTHNDHSPAAAPLKEKTGAATYAFGPHGSGRAQAGPALEEGGDRNFMPDQRVKHGDLISGKDWEIECVFTPGHTSNHMCFALRQEKILFTGDHVMGWSTSVVVPPDGHMGVYMNSLDLLLARDDQIYWPAHGEAVHKPKELVRAFITHRKQREASIIACLEKGMTNIGEMVAEIYQDTDKSLHPAAAMSMLAHLQHMAEIDRVRSDDAGLNAKWQLN